jgi:hypothetical protein
MKTNAEIQALVPHQAAPPEPAEARRTGLTAADLMPVLNLADAVRRRNFMVEVTRTLMKPDIDYGSIAGSKPTLLKPGAERLCTVFGLSVELHVVAAIEDWTGNGEGHGEPLFYYHYRVRLTRNGILIAEGDGSCNSRESKYRYRAGERKCPKCGKPAIIRGREEYGGGWLCFAKKGGCGAKFKGGDAAIEGQSADRVINPDIADQVNTIQKMAYKRALIAAVLIATNASEFYTQDMEEMEVIDVPPAPAGRRAPPEPEPQAKPQPKPDASTRPWRSFKGMVNEFAKLHGKVGADFEHLYYSTLKEFNVSHSNEFKDVDLAEACYRRLLERVQQVEAAAREAEAMPTEDFEPPEPEAVL